MTDLLVAATLIAGVAIVMVLLALIAVRVRRSGRAGPAIGAAMAAYDEAMHATAHQTFVEMQQQQDRRAGMPAARGGRGE